MDNKNKIMSEMNEQFGRLNSVEDKELLKEISNYLDTGEEYINELISDNILHVFKNKNDAINWIIKVIDPEVMSELLNTRIEFLMNEIDYEATTPMKEILGDLLGIVSVYVSDHVILSYDVKELMNIFEN